MTNNCLQLEHCIETEKTKKNIFSIWKVYAKEKKIPVFIFSTTKILVLKITLMVLII